MVHPKASSVAPDVKYEFQMFRHAWNCLYKYPDKSKEKNVHEECFLLHARVLREFFQGENRRKDNVKAKHYFDNSEEWDDVSKSLRPFLKNEISDIHKRLAHLSYDRVGKNTDLDYPKINAEIESAIGLFVAELPTERQQWF